MEKNNIGRTESENPLQKEIEEIRSPIIRKIYPDKIYLGKRFNVQKDTQSAIGLIGEFFSPNSIVHFDNIPLKTTFGSETYITALVPEKLLNKVSPIKINVANDNYISNIVLLEIINSSSKEIEEINPIIRKISPDKIYLGKRFNVQEDTHSAIGLIGEFFSPNSIVHFDNKPLKTTFGSETFITALVPEKLLSKASTIKIYVANNKNISNTILFEIINSSQKEIEEKKINFDGIKKIIKGLTSSKTGNTISCLFIIPDREAPLNCAHVGISSIASYIHEYGRFNSQGINTCLFSDAEIKKLIQKNQYEYIFITMITGQHEHVISISELIKSVDPKIKIVIGGPHIAISKYEMLEKSSDIDYLIVGEGEKTALELLENAPLAEIKGLIFRDANGAIIENPDRPFTENLDEFPAPDLDIYLRTNWLEYPIITSRGCVYKCNFCCSSKIWKHKLRFRSIESIEKEVFQINKRLGRNDHIIISDDFFNFKKERTLKLCDIFKKFGIKYFVRGIRADKVDSDIAMALKVSGCIGCGVGVESVDNSSLKMMNKNVRFDEIERGCKLLMENGISIYGQFIIGNIGDTLETVKRSIEFGKKINVASFFPIYVLAGTELEDYVMKNKLLLPNPYKVDGLKGKKQGAYIFFETEIFPLEERIKAIHLADEAGFLT